MYVFDTNSFIVMFNHYYFERFPSFWIQFDELISTDKVISVREVYNEVMVYANSDSRLVQWAKNHHDLFKLPSAEEMKFVGLIFAVKHFTSLIRKKETLEGRPVADPFLIAKAKIENTILVTQEEIKENAAKIPNICKHFGIQYTNLKGFMEKENWQF